MAATLYETYGGCPVGTEQGAEKGAGAVPGLREQGALMDQ